MNVPQVDIPGALTADQAIKAYALTLAVLVNMETGGNTAVADTELGEQYRQYIQDGTVAPFV